MLEGYVSDKQLTNERDNKSYSITTFQGEHKDEFVVKETNSGTCQLFYKGVLHLSWKEIDNKREGVFTVYDKGKAVLMESWDSLLNQQEWRRVRNTAKGMELVIGRKDTNRVIYRGGYDHITSMKREGKGMEYDEESGRLLRCGVWKNDELFQISQEFESENVMIEYKVEEGKENVSPLNRNPVYEGGYLYDEATGSYLRYGEGVEIDMNTGIAKKEGEWVKGSIKKNVELFEGWYVKGEHDASLKFSVKGAEKRVEILNDVSWFEMNRNMQTMEISTKQFNEDQLTVLDLSPFSLLKSISIGNGCCEKVRTMKLVGLKQLECLLIGTKCFTAASTKDNPLSFTVADCPLLKRLAVGRDSFAEFGSLTVESLPSLQTLSLDGNNFHQVTSFRLEKLPRLVTVKIGEDCFTKSGDLWFNNSTHTLSISDCAVLKQLTIGNGSFPNYGVITLSNVNYLEQIHIGDKCFKCVKVLKIDSFLRLDTLEIGESSFTAQPSSYGIDVSRHFALTNCPRMRKLVIGNYSFSDYPDCTLSNLPSLESIAIGGLDYNYKCYSFCYASLELKSLLPAPASV